MKASLCLPLSMLFKESFIKPVLPISRKTSAAVPVFKKGDSTLYSNYRPISFTRISCKVMKSMIRDVMTEYMYAYNLICPSQHGFMKSHTTGTQLLECTNDWSEEIENGNCIDVCCIDFCRASNSVSISKLMYKLSCYGFSKKLHAWLSNFLSDTIFCIKINACTSKCFEKLSGILQGERT
jgi:hypothetical protein